MVRIIVALVMLVAFGCEGDTIIYMMGGDGDVVGGVDGDGDGDTWVNWDPEPDGAVYCMRNQDCAPHEYCNGWCEPYVCGSDRGMMVCLPWPDPTLPSLCETAADCARNEEEEEEER